VVDREVPERVRGGDGRPRSGQQSGRQQAGDQSGATPGHEPDGIRLTMIPR
jgi:hypothetical protein